MIGIVIPSYNQGEYLEKAIESVIANKKHENIKLVIMDGGSTDGSLDIIRKYEGELAYWVSEPDRGQSHAINKGMEQLADCEYVMWLNSDDEYEDEYAVHDIAEYARTNEYSFVYGKSHFIDKTGNIIGDYPTQEYNVDTFYDRCIVSQPSVLVKRSLWESAGGINESFHMCLDYELWIRLSGMVIPFYYDRYIGNTRMYEDTKTATSQKKHLAEAMAIMQHYRGEIPDSWIDAWIAESDRESLVRFLPYRIRSLRCYGSNRENAIRNIIASADIKWME